MSPEDAKQIAEAIAVALVKRPQGFSIESIKDQCVKILTTDPAAPAEKEYRAGEWVPSNNKEFWYVSAQGNIFAEVWSGALTDKYLLAKGNVYPTKAIAEAGKKHNEWWTNFDMADEGGKWEISAAGLELDYDEVTYSYGCPKFKSGKSARAWVESHGGEAYVSEMLTKGRVFRFKWGRE